MRRLLYSLLIVFASQCVFAQDEVAGEVAALRQLIELQSAQLESLTQRVAELEGRNGESQATSGGLVALEMESVSIDDRVRPAQRTEAIEAGEIGLDQKKDLRTGKESVIVEDAIALSETMDLYGSMRIFAEGGTDDPALNDGSSRLGIRLGRDLPNGNTLFGRIEWKTNLVDNESELLQGDADPGGGVAIAAEDTDKALSTRLGYLGMRFDDIGELSFGKQWSVYYDVAGWTDNFNVYGGAGLSVYSSGTDGGAVGSGRADNAVVWRNERGKFSYGLQTQLKTSSDDDNYKGLGGSMIYSPSDAWDIGFAFAAARVKGAFEQIAGDNDSNVATLGVRYQRGPWNAALSIAKWDNHEAVFFDDDTLIYDGVGAELYASYEWSNRMHLYGGFNYTDPDIDDPRVDPGFGAEFLIFGASWFATKDSFAYLEGLLSTSKKVTGEDVDSVISAGYRFDF
ncbi:MAG: porin [Woeseiaceae bacterium]